MSQQSRNEKKRICKANFVLGSTEKNRHYAIQINFPSTIQDNIAA